MFPSGPLEFSLIFLVTVTFQAAVAQIPTACADRQSLEGMTCCPLTEYGVCGEEAGRGRCVEVNFAGHNNATTDVRANWPHYYTRVCSCSGNFGGYDCSRCNYGRYGDDCASRAIIPRRPVRDFTDKDWEDFVDILRLTKTYDPGYLVVLEETLPGTGELSTANVSLFDFMIWMHHYAAKDSSNISKKIFANQLQALLHV